MKRLALALGLALALSACARNPQPSAPNPEAASTVSPRAMQSYYQPDTTIERGTRGAVRVYQMDEAARVEWMAMLGDRILVCTDGSTLSLLDGETLEPVRRRDLDTQVTWDSPAFRISGDRIGFYDRSRNSYVILNDQLITQSILEIPAPLSIDPVISSDLKAIYYADETGIRVMQMGTGNSRILRQEADPIVSLDGMLFENEQLYYRVREADGRSRTCFIRSADGSLVRTSRFDDQLISWGGHYAGVMRFDYPLGTFQRMITGEKSSAMMMLQPQQDWQSVLLPGGTMAVTQLSNQVGLVLMCYDLETGLPTSSLVIPQRQELFTGACIQGDDLWLWNEESSRFCCWNMAATPPEQPSSALTVYSSLTASRTVSIASCVRLAESMEERYGIRIAFTEHDNRTQGLDYSPMPDYRPQLYSRCLTLLENALMRFPEGFLNQVGSRTYYGDLHIHLVDDFDPALPYPGGTGSTEFIDGGVIVNVSMCRDLEELFYLQLGYAIDARITSLSDEPESWPALNPVDFSYGTDPEQAASLLAGKNAFFADAESMGSARDERARLFRYAMLPDREDLFASEPLQEKLRFLCELIRSTYELPAETPVPWEQYLHNS